MQLRKLLFLKLKFIKDKLRNRMIDKHINYILSIRWVEYILIEISFRNNFQLCNL